MRIAWIGPMPNDNGGASGVSRQLINEMSKYNVEIDCFLTGSPRAIPTQLNGLSNVSFFCQDPRWRWNRWYSRNRMIALLTGQYANLRAENKLAKLLVANHLDKPYDIVYQFSHIEISSLKRFKNILPPLVLHPSVHAAGELKWHRREAHLSKVSEPFLLRISTRMMLLVRSWIQKRHIKIPDFVLCLSRNFSEGLIDDYHVDTKRLGIVPNPIDIERYSPGGKADDSGPLVLLFVSRMAVRKGVEMIVTLSHNISDLADKVQIRVIGNRSLWSDYTPLLKDLDTRVATYVGQISSIKDMVEEYRHAHVLIQPSHYEPFGLTVAEALACGLPVVVSNSVGAGEDVNPECCRVCETGNVERLEQSVRALVSEISDTSKREEISRLARSEALRLFDGPVVAEKLLTYLKDVAGKTHEISKLKFQSKDCS